MVRLLWGPTGRGEEILAMPRHFTYLHTVSAGIRRISHTPWWFGSELSLKSVTSCTLSVGCPIAIGVLLSDKWTLGGAVWGSLQTSLTNMRRHDGNHGDK